MQTKSPLPIQTLSEFTNWGKTIISHPKVVVKPTTLDDLIAIMKDPLSPWFFWLLGERISRCRHSKSTRSVGHAFLSRLDCHSFLKARSQGNRDHIHKFLLC